MSNLQSRIATGLTRLWIVVSILWIGIWIAAGIRAYIENPGYFSEPQVTWWRMSGLVFGPPLALAVVLIVIGWIIDGFTE